MKTYRALLKQEFAVNQFRLVPIRFEDRYLIMNWRNEQIYHLRQIQILTASEQDKYFENVIVKLFDKEKPEQILFSFLKNENCIGYGGLVHINWRDKNAELSFVMDTALEEEEFENMWCVYLELIQQVAFEEMRLHKISTYAYDLRPRLYKVLERMSFVLEARLKDQTWFHGDFIDVIIHSKINFIGK